VIPNPWSYSEANTEHSHQVALFMWCNVAKRWLPELGLLFAIPNGGQRAPAVAARMKAEGVKAGVPDMMLPVQSRGSAGLFIELKRLKATGKARGLVSANQDDWIKALRHKGYFCGECWGWESARDILLWYIDYNDTELFSIDNAVSLVFGRPIN
jgi:hypothetical protein